MSLFQKIMSIIFALVTLFGTVVLIMFPDLGHLVMVLIVCVFLLFSGIKYLVYYFQMAKNMVGGKAVLYRGIILCNIGIFSFTLSDIPQMYIMIYLLGLFVFFGFISIMRALEMKKLDSNWRLKFSEGLMYIVIAIVGLVFITSNDISIYICCVGLIYSSVMRIVSAFRRTAIVYIQ